jgi:hypothetical protein
VELIIELGRLVGGQGPWAAASVGIFGLLVLAVLKWVDAERRCYITQAELQEKRLAEKESTVIALRSGNETNAKLADALSANTDALTSNTSLTIQLGKDIQFNDEHWKLRAQNWEASYAEFRTALNDIKNILAKLEDRRGRDQAN